MSETPGVGGAVLLVRSTGAHDEKVVVSRSLFEIWGADFAGQVAALAAEECESDHSSFRLIDCYNCMSARYNFWAHGYSFVVTWPLRDPESGPIGVFIAFLRRGAWPSELLISSTSQYLVSSTPSVLRILRAETLNRRLNEAHTRFSAGTEAVAEISHDIRSPMANLSALLRLLRMQVANQELQELIDGGIRNCLMVNSLLEDLTGCLMQGRGAIKPTMTKFDLAVLLNELATQYAPLAREKGLTFEVETLEVCHVENDQTLLQRILANLISNAIKFTPSGCVRLICKYNGSPDEMIIMVSDTGCGISELQKANLFQPFFRAEEHSAIPGFGLGLALSQGLAHACGTTIRCESAPGAGTSFSFVIKGTGPGKVQSVLIADDDQDCARSLGRLIHSSGYSVEVALNEADCIEKLESGRFTVLVTDYHLGQKTSCSMIARIASHHPALRIAIWSGCTLEGIRSPIGVTSFKKSRDEPELIRWIGEN